MFDDLLKLIKNSPRWAHLGLVRRLGFSYGHPEDDDEMDLLTDVDTDWTKLHVSGTKPPVRSGHSSAVVNGTMYVFGGYNEGNCHYDLYSFSLIHHHWTKLENRGGIMPDGRASHAWCSSTDKKKLYLFGGSGPHWGQTNMGKLLQFCLATNEWSVVPTTGTHPPPGYGQSMVSINHKLYLFGGTSGHVYVNDLYVFDETTLTWICIPTHGPKPSPRYKHQAIVVGHDMYIIGGGLYDPPKGPIDMHKFDTITSTWNPVTCHGTIPCSRIAHTVSCYNSTSFYMFGGRDEAGIRLNELSCFDIKTCTWKLMEEDINVPDPRDFHTSALWNCSMYIFGGSNGDERNSDVYRYDIQHEPSTLTLLAIQTIQKNWNINGKLRKKYNDIYLPEEIHQAIQELNQHVKVISNDQWYPFPKDRNLLKK